MLCISVLSYNIWLRVLQMHVDSWFHLGVMHLNGLGVKKNLQQALNYFASAAKYGHVLAQYNLAMLHLQNSGTEKCAPTATLALSSRMHCLPCLLSLLDLVVRWCLHASLAHVPSHSDATGRITVERGAADVAAGMGAWQRWAG